MSEITPHPRDSLQYVCDMLDQLKAISATQGGPVLAYLLDMARQEAADQLYRHGGKPLRNQRDTAV